MSNYWIGIACGVIGFLMALVLMMVYATAKKPGLWRRLAYHYLLYLVDIVLVLTGFVLGFGLEVVSWFWVLVPALIGRFIIHMFNTMMVRAEAREEPLAQGKAPELSEEVHSVSPTEDVRDEYGTILWTEPYPFSRLDKPGATFIRKAVKYTVISCERQPSGTISTVVRRVP